MMVDWSGGQSTPAGKATAENPAGSGFASEEVEALPAESDCPQRKSTYPYVAGYRLCDEVTKHNISVVCFQSDDMLRHSFYQLQELKSNKTH
ncbi:hypothetical protein JOC34_001975 [Virgibacillus halotolerans]|nr:hypothetical protein [Virgibacillus halotolerans]